MIIRQTDDGGDWRFGRGQSDYALDEAAIEENIRTRLNSWVGDAFFALQEGVDWRNRIGVAQQDALVDEVKSVLLQSEGVVAINSVFSVFDPVTRNFTINYNVQTIFSPSFQAEIQQTSGAGV
jgi:hypothetical protein